MNRHLKILLILPLPLLAVACGRESVDSLATEAEDTLMEDSEALQERLTVAEQEIPLVDPSGAQLTGLLPGVETFLALQIGELIPPTVAGSKLQANDVVIDGTLAYVSYNMVGEPYLGAIDVLDINQIVTLKISTGLTSSASEYNGLAKDGNTLYAVGASSALASGTAFLTKIALNNGQLTSSRTTYPLPSYAGNSVNITSDKVLATSGDAGGLSIFKKSTMELVTSVPITDARSVDVLKDDSIVTLSGRPGKATVLTSAGAVVRTVVLGGASIAESKSTLEVGSKWSLASLGDGGMTVFCNSDGAIIQNIPQVTVNGLSSSRTVTNAASSADGLIFSANGEAGVYVYSLKDLTTGNCGTGKVTLLGSLNFGSGFSANAVFYKKGLLFVVTGTGGLRILVPVFKSTEPLSVNL